MVKFGKNKFKILNKLAKKQNNSATSNKVIKKKINNEKKISFQKEIVLKQAFQTEGLVKNVKNTEVLQNKKIKPVKQQPLQEEEEKKVKFKSVEKQKKRQKTQISDRKLLLSLMKKK